MKITLRIISPLLFLIICATNLSAKPWRGVSPAKSTRDDVARLLNQPINSSTYRFKYENNTEKVEFVFSGSGRDADCVTQLQPGTVLMIVIIPKTRLNLADFEQETLKELKAPAGTFIWGPGANDRSQAYLNETQGFVVTTANGIVHKIVYVASKEDQALCPAYYRDAISFVDVIPFCILCPTISVTCPDEVEDGGLVSFTANITQGVPIIQFSYTWTVTGGKILEGQGTESIKVNSKGLQGKSITATVEVGGGDPACPRTASCATPITRKN